MVAIVPPAGWDVGGSTAPNSNPSAPTASPTTAEPAFTLSTSASTVVPTDFAFDVPLEPAPARVPVEEALPVQFEAASGGVSSVVWWLAGGAAALVVAGVTFALWPSSHEQPTAPTATIAAKPIMPAAPEPAETKPDAKPSAPASFGSNNATSPKTVAVDPKPKLATEKVAVAAGPSAAAAPSGQKPPIAAAPTPPSAPAKPANPSAAINPPPTAAATAKPAMPSQRLDAPSTVASTGGSNHVLKFDPLDFDPEHLSLSTPHNTGTSDKPSAVSPGSIPTEATAETASQAAGEKSAPAEDAPLAIANAAIQVRRGPAIPPATQPLNASQRLATKVKSLQFNDVALAKFVDTLGELAGTPITLDPRVLELNGQSPRSTVSVNVADVPVEQVLREKLTENRLELDESHGRLNVALVGTAEQRSVDFDLKDLVSEGDASSIAKLIEQFVAPRSWKAGGGKGTITVDGGVLHIDQTLSIRREALIFCERLRLARGRSLRSKYPTELLTVDSPYAKLSTKLQLPTTFTYLPWMRLADFARELHELTGLTVLVDWAALADVNLEPASPLACSVNNRPWGEALDGVLEPLGLAWWAVDGQTLQITSRDAVSRIERVEFYAIPKAQWAASAAFADSLKKAIAERPNKADQADNVRMQVDEPSGRLIVRASPEVHRFLVQRLETVEKR